jgi:hypothetical protein
VKLNVEQKLGEINGEKKRREEKPKATEQGVKVRGGKNFSKGGKFSQMGQIWKSKKGQNSQTGAS